MPYLLNVLYLFAIFCASPWLLYKALTTGKYRRGMLTKLFGSVPPSLLASPPSPLVWFHGVSVGEVHLLRQVISAARARFPHWRIVISTTTDTGYEEARTHFADLPVILWPLDFTWAIKRALDRIKPDVVVLAEGEIWPNFIRIAKDRGVALAVINARMSPRSAARYRKLGWLTRGILGRIDVIAAQTEEYAANFRSAGATNVVATGSVKYDGARTTCDNPRTDAMRRLLGIALDELVWVAGSTQDPEEEIVLTIYQRALAQFPNLRLILVPRQKERFNPVADLLKRTRLSFVRRSEIDAPPLPGSIILLDTFGELSAVWGLADVAFVGGTLDGKRGGQNMIEPAAYGAAVLFGPHTWNFKETVARLLERQAAIRVKDEAELHCNVTSLLGDAKARARLGEAARSFVVSQQGATARTLDTLELLMTMRDSRAAA